MPEVIADSEAESGGKREGGNGICFGSWRDANERNCSSRLKVFMLSNCKRWCSENGTMIEARTKYKIGGMIIFFQQTAIGEVGIAEGGGFITNLWFSMEKVPQNIQLSETELIREAFRQLDAYTAGELREFTLPLAPKGTVFMRKVWGALGEIPYGTTVAYRDVATAAGNPKASRAVGMANNRNPIPVFIPCHRVIGSDGGLTGYRGGLDLKRQLLDLERQHAL